MVKYNLNFKNQIRFWIIPILLMSIPFVLYFNGLPLFVAFYMCIPLSILYVIPNLFLHINHFEHSKGRIFNFMEDSIIEEKEDQKIFYKMAEIDSLTFHATKGKLAGLSYQRLPFQEFYYVMLKFKDGSELIISCIFSANINKFLYSRFKGKIEINEKPDFFPLINTT